MRKYLFLLILVCVCVICVHAETIILRTGTRVEGTIVFENEEVVIVRNSEGARFQYPRAEIVEIVKSEELREKSEALREESAEEIQTGKRVSALLELSGGAGVQPKEATGGGCGVDLLVGTHHIGSRHLFIGGGLGYHGMFLGKESYHFLPIQVALRLPFTEEKHAPVFGVSLGYGVALSKEYKGGLYVGLDFGYRCQVNLKAAIAIVAFAHFQQAQVMVQQQIEDEEYSHRTGRNMVSPGIKIALYF